jgi:hypothetical protein
MRLDKFLGLAAIVGVCACDGTAPVGGTLAPDGGNGCTADTSYQPSIDADDFTTVIDNPLYPLPVGAEWVLESEDEVITITVTNETYTTANGVECVVVHDVARTPDGEVIEDTRDWFAQDRDGNVWYMGEDTAEYEDGEVVSRAGSWEAGVDGAQPGIIMWAEIPGVGERYRQEYYACEAEDFGEIVAINRSVSVEAGDFTGCLRTRDFTPLEPDLNEQKTYCPGVGLVLVEDVAAGERAEELTSVEIP